MEVIKIIELVYPVHYFISFPAQSKAI